MADFEAREKWHLYMPDLRYCLEKLAAEPDSQFWRRSMVLFTFLNIEATMNAMAVNLAAAREAAERSPVPLRTARVLLSIPAEEILLAQDLRHVVSPTGKVSVETAYLGFKQRFLLLFRLLARVGEVQPVDTSRNEWRLFVDDAIGLRNELVHSRHEVVIADERFRRFSEGQTAAKLETARILSAASLAIDAMDAELHSVEQTRTERDEPGEHT